MDLSTSYLGLRLAHPLMVGAGPLADTLDAARRLEDAGAAAIVMRSLFEEQVNREAIATIEATELHAHAFGEASTYLPEHEDFVLGPDSYLSQLARLKGALRIPVIASLNGASPGGWLDFARQMQQAGADALELNIYGVALDAAESAADIEQRQVEMVRAVREAVAIPIAVKLSPFYTSLANFAHRLVAAGADGLVLFNRFYEPDIDLENLELVSHLSLSDASELRLRLRWLAVLSGSVRASLAVTGGVHLPADVVKALMCGADAVQTVSAIISNGAEHLSRLRRDLVDWLEANGYTSLEQLRGSMNAQRCPDPGCLERANYMHMLQTWSTR